ncbi:hypothetical protein [Campylobacter sp. RM16187]|uniref:hypothetical protein n=1 Tax=Campylobacter sp. RM16187 TaxID=1660063 RepID=UPI0021B542DB|nr:hypothetical protein [Campylobacter sp. RM16187]QKG28775.1 hypothetical protein CDOMF_0493 [Campylobacter sp. RM16187]
MNINLNGILIQVLEDFFKNGDYKICVDFNNPKIKEAFFKRADNVFYLSSGRHIKKGSWLLIGL